MPAPCDCLGRTCLTWGDDGELTDLDLELVIQRLAAVDPQVTALLECSPDAQPLQTGRQYQASSAWVSTVQSDVGMATQVSTKPAAIWSSSRND